MGPRGVRRHARQSSRACRSPLRADRWIANPDQRAQNFERTAGAREPGDLAGSVGCGAPERFGGDIAPGFLSHETSRSVSQQNTHRPSHWMTGLLAVESGTVRPCLGFVLWLDRGLAKPPRLRFRNHPGCNRRLRRRESVLWHGEEPKCGLCGMRRRIVIITTRWALIAMRMNQISAEAAAPGGIWERPARNGAQRIGQSPNRHRLVA